MSEQWTDENAEYNVPIDEMHARIAELEAALLATATDAKMNREHDSDRIAELEAIVERLPKTADGVPVMPGDVVWHIEKPGSDLIVAFVVLGFDQWTTDVWGVSGQPETERQSGDGGSWRATRCYSTREAAEAARKAED